MRLEKRRSRRETRPDEHFIVTIVVVNREDGCRAAVEEQEVRVDQNGADRVH